jgi:Arc/MetJ-type ribon-helix-helix transcriptional regulator
MVLSVKSRTQKLIETRLRSGKYDSADELIAAGLAALQQQENFGDFRLGELDALLKAGERSLRGGGVAASEVFADLRRRGVQKRRRARKAG